jgi:hypothetical protein
MRTTRLLLLSLVLAGCQSAVTPPEGVSFASPADGATVGDTFVVRLNAVGLKLVPATGSAIAGEAHHHIFVDMDPTPDGQPIPKGEGIYHIGTGADSLQLVLPPGPHRLIAVPATGDHVPIAGATRDTINIIVQGADSTQP